MEAKEFYAYQRKRFTVLLVWGGLCAIGGQFLAQLNKHSFVRYFWSMSASWGYVNLVIALFGIRGAARNAKDFPNDTSKAQKEAGKMRRLLLINVPLDALYVIAGCWLFQRKSDKARNRGWGSAIIIQGIWLFVYDSWLAGEVKRIQAKIK